MDRPQQDTDGAVHSKTERFRSETRRRIIGEKYRCPLTLHHRQRCYLTWIKFKRLSNYL